MNNYTDEERQTLLQIAHNSIYTGLQQLQTAPINPLGYSANLQQPRACFVTLQKQGQLRGCIGSLQAYRPLVLDVAANAFAAAFSDPRFVALTHVEYQHIALHIAVLSPAEVMHFSSEIDLLQQLRPGVDGLILTAGTKRGTFLPAVWGQLPTPELFLMHLKAKAGLAPDYWASNIKIERYAVESI